MSLLSMMASGPTRCLKDSIYAELAAVAFALATAPTSIRIIADDLFCKCAHRLAHEPIPAQGQKVGPLPGERIWIEGSIPLFEGVAKDPGAILGYVRGGAYVNRVPKDMAAVLLKGHFDLSHCAGALVLTTFVQDSQQKSRCLALDSFPVVLLDDSGRVTRATAIVSLEANSTDTAAREATEARLDSAIIIGQAALYTLAQLHEPNTGLVITTPEDSPALSWHRVAVLAADEGGTK